MESAEQLVARAPPTGAHVCDHRGFLQNRLLLRLAKAEAKPAKTAKPAAPFVRRFAKRTRQRSRGLVGVPVVSSERQDLLRVKHRRAQGLGRSSACQSEQHRASIRFLVVEKMAAALNTFRQRGGNSNCQCLHLPLMRRLRACPLFRFTCCAMDHTWAPMVVAATATGGRGAGM